MIGREHKARRQIMKHSTALEKMGKSAVILFFSLLALGATVGGILWAALHDWVFFIIGIGVGIGIFSICMIGFVFKFLFSFSSGQIDIKEPNDNEVILSETRATLDLIAQANKVAAQNKAKGKNVKPYLFLIYGWIFLTFVFTIIGSAIDQISRPNKPPMFMFIGMGCFAGTILGLIIFGAVIPNAKIKAGSRRVAKGNFSREVLATVKDLNFKSSSSNGVGRVKETFLVTFDTPYGDSKCLYSIINYGRGDTNADNKRLRSGDSVLILINPNDPKYCAIKSAVKS